MITNIVTNISTNVLTVVPDGSFIISKYELGAIGAIFCMIIISVGIFLHLTQR